MPYAVPVNGALRNWLGAGMGRKARMNILIGAGHLGQRAQQPNTAWRSPLAKSAHMICLNFHFMPWE